MGHEFAACTVYGFSSPVLYRRYPGDLYATGSYGRPVYGICEIYSTRLAQIRAEIKICEARRQEEMNEMKIFAKSKGYEADWMITCYGEIELDYDYEEEEGEEE